MKPSVFIIILNWNGYNDTVACIRSLQNISYPDYKIIVVDNGSKDGTVEMLKDEFEEVVLIANKENLGFAGGNNVGIRYALEEGADYVMLLNNDTVVEKGFLDSLVRAVENPADEEMGIVGPKIYSGAPGSSVLWEAGGGIDWQHGMAYHNGFEEMDRGQWDGIRDVDYVSGCAMLIKREVLKNVGLLDEDFFLYYEETDFCTRAKGKGYRVVFVPDSRIWHKESNTTGGAYSPVFTYYMTRNRLLFMRRYMEEDGWKRFIRYFYYEGLLRRAVFLCVKSRRKIRSLMALWAGWRDFRHSRFCKGPEWL